MGKRFDLLVFDWDGTVVDSAGHIVDSIQAACRDLDLPVPSPDARPPYHRPGLGRRHGLPVARSAAERISCDWQSATASTSLRATTR